MSTTEPVAYLIDADEMRKLRAIQAALHGGTDRERDAGHKIWLALNNAQPVTAEELSAPKPAPYNEVRIAWELERTALGDGHYGNALRAAKDMSIMTDKDRALLDRFATGKQLATDHVKLQELALLVDRLARSRQAKETNHGH